MRKKVDLLNRARVYVLIYRTLKFRAIKYFSMKLINKSDTMRLHRIKVQTQKQFLNNSTRSDFSRSLSYVFSSHVEGDIAEFGTQTGTSSISILAITEILNMQTFETKYSQYKKIHFFDSFTGFPEITSEFDQKSHHVINRIWKKGGCVGLNFSEFNCVMNKLSATARFTITPGFFKDSLNNQSLLHKFSWVHVDCDLYESTLCVLNYLFSNRVLSEGGILLLSDFYANRGDSETGQQLAWREVAKKYQVNFHDLGFIGTMSNAFLIRSYNGRY